MRVPLEFPLLAARRHCQISNSRLSLLSIGLRHSTVAGTPEPPTAASGNVRRGVSRRQRDLTVDRDDHFGLATIGLRDVETPERDTRLTMSGSRLATVLTSEMGAGTGTRTSETSVRVPLEASGDGTTEGGRKKWVASPVVVAATPMSSRYCRIGSAFPWRYASMSERATAR